MLACVCGLYRAYTFEYGIPDLGPKVDMMGQVLGPRFCVCVCVLQKIKENCMYYILTSSPIPSMLMSWNES